MGKEQLAGVVAALAGSVAAAPVPAVLHSATIKAAAAGDGLPPGDPKVPNRAAPRQDPQAGVKKDHGLIQGKWALVDGEFGGMKFQVPPPPMTYAFRGDDWELRGAAGAAMKGTFKLSPGGKHSGIDFDFDPKTVMNGPPLFLPSGIYRVQGDSLWVCLGNDVGARPPAFSAPNGTNHVLYVFKRVPPK